MVSSCSSTRTLGSQYQPSPNSVCSASARTRSDARRSGQLPSSSATKPALSTTSGDSRKPARAAPGASLTPAAPSASAEPERSPDEAYIETPRCSTCNECTTINSKMFAYDGNKQAYIADINAGTYAQLVEAAESCQVSIIHPGKPRNPKEPGLEELIKRAEPFL